MLPYESADAVVCACRPHTSMCQTSFLRTCSNTDMLRTYQEHGVPINEIICFDFFLTIFFSFE